MIHVVKVSKTATRMVLLWSSSQRWYQQMIKVDFMHLEESSLELLPQVKRSESWVQTINQEAKMILTSKVSKELSS